MKNLYLYLGLGALLVVIVGYGLSGSKPEAVTSDLVPVRIGYNAGSIGNASVIVALEKGYFEDRGISPQPLALKSGSEIAQALAAGQVDFGIGGFANLMTLLSKGAPFRIITASSSAPSYLFVRPNGELNRLTDLYGKNMVSGGTSGLSFRMAMKELGLDADQVNMSDLDRSYQVIALMEKKAVDAIMVSEQDVAAFGKAGAVVLPEWEEEGYSSRFIPRNSYAVRMEFLDQNEDVVGSLLMALADAHRLIKSDPGEAARVLSEHISRMSDGAVVRSAEEIVRGWQYKEILNTVWQDPTVTMELIDMAAETGMIDRPLSIEEVFDLRFASELATLQDEIYGSEN